MNREWPMVSLGELLIQDKTYIESPEVKTYPKLSVKLYGKGVVLDAPVNGGELKMPRHQLAKSGQVILSEIWGKKGAIGFVPADGEGALCTSHFFLFDVEKSKVEPGYLRLIFRANYLEEQLGVDAKGTTGYAAVRPKHLLAAQIPLPPLEEQRRIVARVEAMAAKIEEARGLRHLATSEADVFGQASLKRIRERLLDGTFPIAKLGAIARITSGGTPSRGNPSFWDGDIPWIKTGELVDGEILDAEERITIDGMENSSARLFPVGTVLIALYGQGQTRGRTGLLRIEATSNQACCAILPSKELLPEFTQLWLRSLYSDLRQQSHGGAQPNWNGQMIKNLDIAVLPRDVQQGAIRDAAFLQSTVNRLENLQGVVKLELDALLPSILSRAFVGEL
jgi:type I restriction enzyme, S subunit